MDKQLENCSQQNVFDYQLSGRCQEFAKFAVEQDSSLTLTRGWYNCPRWGKQQHWWTTRQDGSVYDPTANQFPSLGEGEYIPFTGWLECDECGKSIREEDATFYGKYILCTGICFGKFVGVYT